MALLCMQEGTPADWGWSATWNMRPGRNARNMPRNGRCVNGRVAVFGLSGDVSGHKRPCTRVVATLLRAVTHLAASGLCSHTPGCEMAAQLITASNGPRRKKPSMPCPEARSTYRRRGR